MKKASSTIIAAAGMTVGLLGFALPAGAATHIQDSAHTHAAHFKTKKPPLIKCFKVEGRDHDGKRGKSVEYCVVVVDRNKGDHNKGDHCSDGSRPEGPGATSTTTRATRPGRQGQATTAATAATRAATRATARTGGDQGHGRTRAATTRATPARAATAVAAGQPGRRQPPRHQLLRPGNARSGISSD